jgi:hypothetical protein
LFLAHGGAHPFCLGALQRSSAHPKDRHSTTSTTSSFILCTSVNCGQRSRRHNISSSLIIICTAVNCGSGTERTLSIAETTPWTLSSPAHG